MKHLNIERKHKANPFPFKMKHSDHPILLFDGVCNLCNSSVQFFIKHDKKGRVKFAALQSETGRDLLFKFELDPDYFDSLVFIDKEKVYTHSSAVLRASKYLNGLYPLLQVFLIKPKFLRDPIYKWIGRNRYRWFGKQDACMIPTPELKERFL